jgi:thiamine biosynthesis lipoprotein
MRDVVFQTMNTVAQIKIEGGDEEKAIAYTKAVILEMEKRFSFYNSNSEVSQLNQCAKAGEKLPISADLYKMLGVAKELEYISGGMFNVAFASVNNQNAFILYKKSVSTKKGLIINLGAIAKGYAADLALNKAMEFKPSRILISLGGHINCFSTDRPWKIGLQNPKDNYGKILGTLEMTNGSLSTSGETYLGNHITNPLDSNWKSDYASVSVMHKEGIYADGFSTALFLCPFHKLISLYKDNGLSVIIVSGNRIRISKELINSLTLKDSAFTVEALN